MAIINNLQAKLIQSSKLYKCVGQYGTPDILNGGESYNVEQDQVNIISYIFKITGLQGHITKNVIIKSLLLNQDGSLGTSKKFKLDLNGISTSVNLVANDSIKTLIPTAFAWNEEQTTNELELTLTVQNQSKESCYFGLQSILINLQDINYSIQLTFTGPNSNRNSSNIITAALLVNRDAIPTTFSKDPTKEFNKDLDNIEGRAYFKKDGIYVDGYQYSINTTATETKLGVTKLSKPSFEIEYEEDEEGNQVPVGIIAPTDIGIAATPQLVYNTLATAKNYTDEVIIPIKGQLDLVQAALDGIDAPLIINIENNEGEKESLGEELTFSKDFKQENNKLYIAWLEVTN